MNVSDREFKALTSLSELKPYAAPRPTRLDASCPVWACEIPNTWELAPISAARDLVSFPRFLYSARVWIWISLDWALDREVVKSPKVLEYSPIPPSNTDVKISKLASKDIPRASKVLPIWVTVPIFWLPVLVITFTNLSWNSYKPLAWPINIFATLPSTPRVIPPCAVWATGVGLEVSEGLGPCPLLMEDSSFFIVFSAELREASSLLDKDWSSLLFFSSALVFTPCALSDLDLPFPPGLLFLTML